MTAVSVSRMRTLLRCAKEHHIVYHQGWRAKGASPGLLFGRWWHQVMESYWLSERQLAAPLMLIANLEADAYQQAQLLGMLRAYHEWYPSAVPPIGVEQWVEVPLRRGVTLIGRVDLIQERMIIDHKTTYASIPDTAQQRSDTSMQAAAYLLAAAHLGIEVDAVAFDYVVRPAVRPLLATPPEKRKYKRDGGLYANQREHDEDPRDYERRCYAASSAQRFVTTRTPEQLDDFVANTQALAALAADTGHRIPNLSQCTSHTGAVCPFFEHCHGGRALDSAPDLWVQRDTSHHG